MTTENKTYMVYIYKVKDTNTKPPQGHGNLYLTRIPLSTETLQEIVKQNKTIEHGLGEHLAQKIRGWISPPRRGQTR